MVSRSNHVCRCDACFEIGYYLPMIPCAACLRIPCPHPRNAFDLREARRGKLRRHFAYKEGLPVQRQMVLTKAFESVEETIKKIKGSPDMQSSRWQQAVSGPCYRAPAVTQCRDNKIFELWLSCHSRPPVADSPESPHCTAWRRTFPRKLALHRVDHRRPLAHPPQPLPETAWLLRE